MTAHSSVLFFQYGPTTTHSGQLKMQMQLTRDKPVQLNDSSDHNVLKGMYSPNKPRWA